MDTHIITTTGIIHIIMEAGMGITLPIITDQMELLIMGAGQV